MKITAVETIFRGDGSSPLTFVRLHTAAGVIGLGETYYTPRSVTAYVHEVIAPRILGTEFPTQGLPWDELYQASSRRGAGGVDMRALSAVDVAAWDLRGKLLGAPVYELLGGRQEPFGSLVYNTCAGGRYSSAAKVGTGTSDVKDDLWRALNEPGQLAAELLAEGYSGMKVWPFDAYAAHDAGRRIAPDDLCAGVSVLEQIRQSVGLDMDVMLEGHGMWQPAAAERILRAVRHVQILWAEDITLANNPAALRRLADRTGAPLSVSEYLLDRWQYRSVLESGAVSYLHLDPSWCGGITESQRIVSVASAFDVVCAIHDCTGPLNLLAGLHLGAANVNVGYQEVLRSFLDEVYPTMVDTEWNLAGGRLRPPATPGLGAELTEDFLTLPDLVIERSVP